MTESICQLSHIPSVVTESPPYAAIKSTCPIKGFVIQQTHTMPIYGQRTRKFVIHT